MCAGICAANFMLMPCHHLFFPAICHADKLAVIADHPDNAVRLLLVSHVNHAALRDMF